MIASFEAACAAVDAREGTLVLTAASAAGMLLRSRGPKAALVEATRMPACLFWARVVEYLVQEANEQAADTLRPAAGDRR